jgi:aryl-alcohol dehydrogenase-like predicted oxidoreductase
VVGATLRQKTRLILGTAQLGLDYGVNNKQGKLTDAQAFKVLDAAQDNGFYGLDTSPLYGDSERIIGKWNNCLPVFSKWWMKPGERSRPANLIASKILIHNGDEVGECFDHLFDGVSCYDVANAPEWAEYVQFPYSIIDIHNLGFKQTENRRAIIRSVFLQGLLAQNPLRDGIAISFDPYHEILQEWHDWAEGYGMSLCEMSLRYVITTMHPWAMCIGAETPEQVEEIAIWASRGEIPLSICREAEGFGDGPKELTDPRKWGIQYDFAPTT